MADFSTLIGNLNQQGKKWERVLGSKHTRDAVAHFQEKFPDVFQTIATKLLYEFVTLNTFSKDQFEAYQRGIMDFGACLDQCRIESEADNKPVEGEVL